MVGRKCFFSFLSQEVLYFPSSSREILKTTIPNIQPFLLWSFQSRNLSTLTGKPLFFNFVSNLKGYLNVLAEFSVLPENQDPELLVSLYSYLC